MTGDPLRPKDRVELMKSVRASGVVLDAGIFGAVVTAEPDEKCEIRFDGLGGSFLINSKYLRKCSAAE